ncbi:MAG: hypothetical protein FWD17_13245 [Polyangiaceae bacterium]|nr:hypothetical protein [Polyangiaceae bacterium]
MRGSSGFRARMTGAIGVAVCVLLACDAGTPAPSCTQGLPSSCPSPMPSWSGQVETIVATACGSCHADGGIEQAAFDFSTYQGVFGNRGPILTQVYSCAMPPSDAGVTLTHPDRATLVAWLWCKAPNN